MPVSQQPQQTGVLLIMTQQVQPASIMQHMQSQQAWIISQHWLSPLVQVRHMPESVISHLHSPMVRLQVQTGMPLYMTQQVHRPPVSMEQRFWTMLQAILSSQLQVMRQPPWHFSILRVQRGTIIMFVGVMPVEADGVVPSPGMPMLGSDVPVRSIMIVLDIMQNSFPRPASLPVPDVTPGSPAMGLSPGWGRL